MRLRAVFALMAALAGMMLVGLPSAGARAVAQGSDPAYPPTTCAQMSTSTTHPQPGAHITITGSSFDANTRVRLYIKKPRILLRSIITDANGAFSTTVKLPDGLFGNRIIIAVGGQVNVCPVDPIQITIQGGTSNPGGSGNPGGTSFTGVDIGALLAAAAALVGVGVLLNRRGRTTKRATSHVG